MLKKREKVLCTFLVLLLLFSITTVLVAPVSASETAKMYVDPSMIEYWTPALNETFMVNVSIANVSRLQVFNFTLYWNTTLLDLVGVETQDFLNPPIQTLRNETREDLGRYLLCLYSLGNPKNGSGTLVTLTFKITYDPVWPENVTCALDLAETRLYTKLGLELIPIPHDVEDSEYSCYSFPPLSLNIMTDKLSYLLLESVHISGNLTIGFSPVQDGLVALEVDNPDNKIIVIRTLSTSIPPANQTVEILDVISCGGHPDYNPKENFNVGSQAYFNVSVRNNDNVTRTVLITLNLYDVTSTPLKITKAQFPMAAGTSGHVILSMIIPDDASVGEARLYASVFNKLPRNGGIAYCPEKMDTIQIQGGGSLGGTTTGSSGNPEGMYNLTFTLPSDEKSGNYTIYGNSEYTIQARTQKATNEVTFIVSGLGPWDIDGNGVVDVMDVLVVALAFGSRPGDDNWDIRADLFPDELIDVMDVLQVALHFGEGG